MRERKNETFTVLRCLDDYSLQLVKNNDPKTVVKVISWLPPIDPAAFEKFDNASIAQNYKKENFIKKILFPDIYPNTLIDPNYRVLKLPQKKQHSSSHVMQTEEVVHTKSVRCKSCKYILGDLPFEKCGKCNEFYHEHCIAEKKRDSSITKTSKKADKNKTWTCFSCKNCAYCLSHENRETLVKEILFIVYLFRSIVSVAMKLIIPPAFMNYIRTTNLPSLPNSSAQIVPCATCAEAK